ncbi:MAG TPA: glycosyltransferase [Leptolyngbyaceae cyanobacterium]
MIATITHKKPRICIALPGINYLSYSPYVLSTLPVVQYLEKNFDVTVVYRKILENKALDYKYLTILNEDQMSEKEKRNNQGYFSPPNYISLLKYQDKLDKFARKHAKDFDLIMEKEWPYLGAFSHAFSKYNVPTVLLAEAVYKFEERSQPFWQGNPLKKAMSIGIGQWRLHLRKQWGNEAGSIIVETEQLKEFLLDGGYANPKTPIYSIPYGVNSDRFYPRDRDFCREQLGISKDRFVLTYVGSLNRFIQEPSPIIEALGLEKPQNVVLHIVGDGGKRKELEDIARKFNAPAIFHGRVEQQEAALYIGASNICIAPYNKDLFPERKFTTASLKVCEYLGCGRPVLTIPCERMQHLLDGGQYGFLVENTVDDYRKFFRNLPNLEIFMKKEAALLRDIDNSMIRKKKIVLSWEDIAGMHQQVINETLSEKFSLVR